MPAMFATLLQVVQICLPVFVLVGLGQWLTRRQLLVGDAKRFAAWMVWNWCLPAMILNAVLRQPLAELLDWPIIVATVCATVALAGYGALVSRRPGEAAPAMAVAPFWANLTYLGFPLAISAYGDAGLRVAAIVNAFTMPLFIVLGSVLLVWRSASAGERTADVNSDADADADADAAASTAAPSVLQALRIGVVNPVSLAALGGVAVVAIGEQLGWQHWFAIEAVARPLAVAEQVVGMIAAMGLPLALLCVGAELDFGRLQGQRHQLLAMSAAKLVLAPTLTWVLLAAWAAIWPGTVDSTALSVAVMMMALPSAVGAFVMATNLRAGTKVLAGHLVASTVVACLTVPLWLWILLLVYPTTGS